MLSERERNVMQHALAWPHIYRNSFYAEIGKPNHAVWVGLVDSGLAVVHRDQSDSMRILAMPRIRYMVTLAGIWELAAVAL